MTEVMTTAKNFSTAFGNKNILRPGDELYVPSQWSIDHGDTDMDGGIAVVKKIHKHSYGTFVECENLSHQLNIEFLLADDFQEEWEIEYGSRLAHDCPEGKMCPNPQKFDLETFQLLPIKRRV